MGNKEDQYDQIDAFLLGQLSEEGRLTFIAAMENDAALKSEVELHKGILEASRIKGRKELTATLDKIHAQKERSINKTIPLKKRNWSSWIAAASIALLLACWFLFSTPSNNAMAGHYYEPYNLTIGLRDDNAAEQVTQIDALYAEQNYATAAPLIEIYLKENPANNTLRLALAICQYESNDFTTALQTLQAINQDPFLKDQAKWYSALIYLKTDEVDQSKALLKILAADKGADHHQEAVELLAKL